MLIQFEMNHTDSFLNLTVNVFFLNGAHFTSVPQNKLFLHFTGVSFRFGSRIAGLSYETPAG